jgi:hypothetical protein
MGLFELEDVESSGVYVLYDCNVTATKQGTTARDSKISDWNTAITSRHQTAYNNFEGAAEARAHAFSNPFFDVIRAQIP